MFSYTTGGPFGMEEWSRPAPGLTLIYLLVIPLAHSGFVRCRGADHGDPIEGGFYRWVRGLRYFGVFVGWWKPSASRLLARRTRFCSAIISPFIFLHSLMETLFVCRADRCARLRQYPWYSNGGSRFHDSEFSVLIRCCFVCDCATQWHQNPFPPLTPPHVPPFKVFGVGLALTLALFRL